MRGKTTPMLARFGSMHHDTHLSICSYNAWPPCHAIIHDSSTSLLLADENMLQVIASLLCFRDISFAYIID
jgi:hypothetical protein